MSAPNPGIRTYLASDLDEVLAVWSASSAVAHPFLSSDFQAKERVNIAEIYLPNTDTSVYVSPEGVVVGFIAMMDNEIGGLFVDPSCQRMGIGHKLLAHVQQSRDTLEVEVFKANTIGCAFYNKAGFQLIEEKVHEPTGQPLLRLARPKP